MVNMSIFTPGATKKALAINFLVMINETKKEAV